MHKLLIISRHAADYRRLIDAARLPDLEMTAASDAGKSGDIASPVTIAFPAPSTTIRLPMSKRPPPRYVEYTIRAPEGASLPALKRQGVDRCELVLLTHQHRDSCAQAGQSSSTLLLE